MPPASRNTFRVADDKEDFFVSKRKKTRQDPKLKPGEIPALVLPCLYEREKAARTPRGDIITLPSITPRPIAPSSGMASATTRSTSLSSYASLGSMKRTPQTARAAAGPTPPVIPRPPKAGPPVRLPRLTFEEDSTKEGHSNTNKGGRGGPTSLGMRNKNHPLVQSALYLDDYDGGTAAAEHGTTDEEKVGDLLDTFETAREKREAEYLELSTKDGGTHNVTTIDEEASVRVLKGMFQLNLTRNSTVIARLRELDQNTLLRRVANEMSHRKQLTKDEFHNLLCRILKDDFVNRRDANTLFGVFDSDKSGLVDAAEFLSGLLALVTSGVDDIAFRFINTLLEGREKSTVNAFISRFELDVLVDAAQRHYCNDPDVVHVLGKLAETFNFSHHLGRIPVLTLRQRILEDDDYRTIFENLPVPGALEDELVHPVGTASTISTDAADHQNLEWGLNQQNMIADQHMHPDWKRQAEALETDQPEWFTKEGTVFRTSKRSKFPEPVFLRERTTMHR